MLFVRVTESFEPASDLELRFPEWTVIQTDQMPNGTDEMFFPAEQTIFIDPSACDLEWAQAHIAAHLTLEHHLNCDNGFTDAQESEASWLAAMRMDYRPAKTLMALPQQPLDVPRQHLGFYMDDEDCPMDGPPTVTL